MTRALGSDWHLGSSHRRRRHHQRQRQQPNHGLASLKAVLLGLTVVASLTTSVSAQACGAQAGGAECPDGLCCSRFGFCGSSQMFCSVTSGCQSGCWTPSCGNGVCDATGGETCASCPDDCGACTDAVCGNGVCEESWSPTGESCGTCPTDCGPCQDKTAPNTCVDPSHVALTFDNGPSSFTAELLEILKAENITASFFVVGDAVAKNSATLHRQVQDGHSIGSNSMSLPDFSVMSAKQMAAEIQLTDTTIADVSPCTRPAFFRPPEGYMDSSKAATVSALGMRVLGWTVDSGDWEYGTLNETNMLNNIRAGLVTNRGQAIILLHHDVRRDVVRALPAVIALIKNAGYTFVGMEECVYGSEWETHPSVVAAASRSTNPECHLDMTNSTTSNTTCPVSEWSAWSSCTAHCGSGTQTRTRLAIVPANKADDACADTTFIESRECPDLPSCPATASCSFTDWSEWTACSDTCGGGTRTRTRHHTTGGPTEWAAVDPTCPALVEVELCGMTSCKEASQDCVISDWSEWSTCDMECGDGVEHRTRAVQVAASNGGAECPTDIAFREERPCAQDPCDCVLSGWMPWGTCSADCGGGTQTRNRLQLIAAPEGGSCAALTASRPCNTHACPEECVFTEWSTWTTCDADCDGGTQSRSRALQQPAPEGVTCGAIVEHRACNTESCDRDCAVSEWSTWSSCSASCDGGSRTRTRTVVKNAAPGGATCPALTEVLPCNDVPCPVDCVMTKWSDWSACSADCEGGIQTRVRTVEKLPQFGGLPCGPQVDVEACNPQACDADCVVGDWGEWSQCSKECQGGLQTRYREIVTAPGPQGRPCDADQDFEETLSCNTGVCAQSCQVGEWSDWSECSSECGSGRATRTRPIVVPALNGGAACPNTVEERSCNSEPCDCEFEGWGAWSLCSADCGGGFRTRARVVKPETIVPGGTCGSSLEWMVCNTEPCSEACVVGDWAPWTSCSATCGGGVRTRHRVITSPATNGGDPCLGDLFESEPCATEACEDTCAVGPWSPWSPCSVKCGRGHRVRSRALMNPADASPFCPPFTQQDECNIQDCAVDCQVSEWTAWSDCDADCDGGVRTRTRTVLTHPNDGGAACPVLEEKDQCHNAPCSIDCVVSPWSEWGSCSSSCGSGIRERTRRILRHSQEGGLPCGSLSEVAECNNADACECTMAAWDRWSECSATCGGGTTTRRRSVVSAGAGRDTCGPDSETMQCNTFPCPVDCVMSEWSDWDACNADCDGGVTHRHRFVLSPSRDGGAQCGPTVEAHTCNTHGCPVDCDVSEWTGWTECSSDCAGGTSERFRHIITYPANMGADCAATLGESKPCNPQACEDSCDIGDWGEWSPCSATCGGGQRTRTRPVLDGSHPATCSAALTESTACNLDPCPSDCVLSDWMPWTDCSESCGGGVSSRTRSILSPARNGGAACDSTHEVRDCNTDACTVSSDCLLSDWTTWGSCSKTCGSGVRSRTRNLLAPAVHDGAECGAMMETETCNTAACVAHNVDCQVGMWSEWTPCDAACGTGYRSRSREVSTYPQNDGAGCPPVEELVECNTDECLTPTSCELSPWTAWGQCNKNCGDGKRIRSRTVVTPSSHGGDECGDLLEEETCNTDSCPAPTVDNPMAFCDMGEWSEWTQCSVSCGSGGTEVRTRSVLNPADNGGFCMQPMYESRSCFPAPPACPESKSVTSWEVASPFIGPVTASTDPVSVVLADPDRADILMMMAAQLELSYTNADLLELHPDPHVATESVSLQPSASGVTAFFQKPGIYVIARTYLTTSGMQTLRTAVWVPHLQLPPSATTNVCHRGTTCKIIHMWRFLPMHASAGSVTKGLIPTTDFSTSLSLGLMHNGRPVHSAELNHPQARVVVSEPHNPAMGTYAFDVEWTIPYDMPIGEGFTPVVRLTTTTVRDETVNVVPLVDTSSVGNTFHIKPEYVFKYTDWTPCSHTCGSGYRTRAAECYSIHNNAPADSPASCNILQAANLEQRCFTRPCGEVGWRVGGWGDCTGDCTGTQTRAVECVDAVGAVHMDYKCEQDTKKPATDRACVPTNPCETFAWQLTDWRHCQLSETGLNPNLLTEAACETGIQRRTAICVGSRGTLAHDDSLCGAPPSLEQLQRSCKLVDCSMPHRIHATPWGACSKSCGGGVTARTVKCISTAGSEVSMDRCAELYDAEALATTRECNLRTCSPPSWQLGAWTQCESLAALETASSTVVTGRALHEAKIVVVQHAVYSFVSNAVKSLREAPMATEATASSANAAEGLRGQRAHRRQLVSIEGGTVVLSDAELQAVSEQFPCGSARFRTVECVDDDGNVVDDHVCEGRRPSIAEPCGECNLCRPAWIMGDGDLKDFPMCSNHGTCMDGTCMCDDLWAGPLCDTPIECHNQGGLADIHGECCDHQLDAHGECCDDRLDRDGVCCSVGDLDACGVCGGSGRLMDANGECCDGDLDAGGMCCPATSTVDTCGVCGGVHSCTVRFHWMLALGNPPVPLHDPTATSLHAFEADLVSFVAQQLGLLERQVDITNIARSETRLSNGAVVEGNTLEIEVSILPAMEGAPNYFEETQLRALLSDSRHALGSRFLSLTQRLPAGECGNGLCEFGERCSTTDDQPCCSIDCPVPISFCPGTSTVPGSPPCNGNGVCVSSANGVATCECYVELGYTGEDCSACAPGFTTTPTGCLRKFPAAALMPADDSGDDSTAITDETWFPYVVAGACVAAICAIGACLGAGRSKKDGKGKGKGKGKGGKHDDDEASQDAASSQGRSESPDSGYYEDAAGVGLDDSHSHPSNSPFMATHSRMSVQQEALVPDHGQYDDGSQSGYGSQAGMMAAGVVGGAVVGGAAVAAAAGSRASSRSSSRVSLQDRASDHWNKSRTSNRSGRPSLTTPMVGSVKSSASRGASRTDGAMVDHQSAVDHESVTSDARYTNVDDGEGSGMMSEAGMVAAGAVGAAVVGGVAYAAMSSSRNSNRSQEQEPELEQELSLEPEQEQEAEQHQQPAQDDAVAQVQDGDVTVQSATPRARADSVVLLHAASRQSRSDASAFGEASLPGAAAGGADDAVKKASVAPSAVSQDAADEEPQELLASSGNKSASMGYVDDGDLEVDNCSPTPDDDEDARSGMMSEAGMAAAGAVAGAALGPMAASSSRASSRHSSPANPSPMPSATPLTIPLVHNASRASSHKSHRSNPSRQSGVSVDHQSGVAHESVVSDARYTNVGSPSGSRASSRQSRASQRSHHSDVVEAQDVASPVPSAASGSRSTASGSRASSHHSHQSHNTGMMSEAGMAAAGAVAGAAVVGGVAMAASSSRASSHHSSPANPSPMPSATPLTIPLVHNASRASSHKSHRLNPSRQSGVSVDHQSGVAHESVVSDARYTNVSETDPLRQSVDAAVLQQGGSGSGSSFVRRVSSAMSSVRDVATPPLSHRPMPMSMPTSEHKLEETEEEDTNPRGPSPDCVGDMFEDVLFAGGRDSQSSVRANYDLAVPTPVLRTPSPSASVAPRHDPVPSSADPATDQLIEEALRQAAIRPKTVDQEKLGTVERTPPAPHVRRLSGHSSLSDARRAHG